MAPNVAPKAKRYLYIATSLGGQLLRIRSPVHSILNQATISARMVFADLRKQPANRSWPSTFTHRSRFTPESG